MFKIRRNVFETNSSSTHSIAIYTDKEWEDYNDKKDNLNYLTNGWGEFRTIDEAIKELSESDFQSERELATEIKEFVKGRELKDCLDEEFHGYETLEELLSDYEYYSVNARETMESYSNLEEDHTEYTTPGGEHLHIICKYGYDG